MVATVPETVRPVGWSAFRMMLTSLPGITSLMVGTRDILVQKRLLIYFELGLWMSLEAGGQRGKALHQMLSDILKNCGKGLRYRVQDCPAKVLDAARMISVSTTT
jgi:hypothetical protein